jgi:hypothetical protein
VDAGGEIQCRLAVEFQSLPAVPLPGAAWLFDTTLAGLGFARKYGQREALAA